VENGIHYTLLGRQHKHQGYYKIN